ncbi:lachesin [Patella vulgata]|uniref:lachesin n=1 Tax=Patella vulgata TaxID=6465 RepID=UPI0024A87545|nr:lachesin [Patella vulgata]
MHELVVVFVAIFHVALGELKPKFNQTPEHVTVIAGNKAILPCTVEFRGEHTVIWSSPRKTLISHADRRMIDDHRISVERPYIKEWNLHIRDVRHNDSGTYKCEINTVPIQAKLVTLSVFVPPMIISKYSSDLVVKQETETAELICNVTGIPAPNVTWYKRNFRKGNGYKEKIGLEGGALLIHNVSRYCDDIYECVVDNGVPPPRSKAIRVEVQFAPEVVLTNKRIGQRRGKETILECIIYAHPHSITVWKRNGQKIQQKSDKYSIEVFPDEENRMVTLSLRIMDLESSDYGSYTCEGSNPLGKDAEDMILYVIEPDPVVTHTTTTTTTTYGLQYEIDVNGGVGSWANNGGGISRNGDGGGDSNRGWVEEGGWEKDRLNPTSKPHKNPTNERGRPVTNQIYPGPRTNPISACRRFETSVVLLSSLLSLTLYCIKYVLT